MFSRLVLLSLGRRKRRKLAALGAVWIGITLLMGFLALALDAGDKMNRELSSFGANIKVEPIGAAAWGTAAPGELMEEADLSNLDRIFWRNNILAVVPRLWTSGRAVDREVRLLGIRSQGEPPYEHWNVRGRWLAGSGECVAGERAAEDLDLAIGMRLSIEGTAGERSLVVTGVLSALGGAEDGAIVLALETAQALGGLSGKVSEVDVFALTTPENRLAEKYRKDPRSLTPEEYERWACTPYPGSVAAQVQAAIPGSSARVVRRVSETQGAVLTRVEGLLHLLAVLGGAACSLAVLGVLSSSVLARRPEAALHSALGAHRLHVLALFLAEAALLGALGGLLGGATGLLLGGELVLAVFGEPMGPHRSVLFLGPLLGAALGALGSLIPALRASRTDVARLLHGA